MINSTSVRPLHILLADDDEDDRTFFREALQELSIQTAFHAVENGFQLLDYLNPQHSPPDLLFLDLNMPGRSGMECLHEIRSRHNLDWMKVIIFSTSATHRDVEEAFVRGADLYLQKPSGFSVMVNKLERVLQINWVQFLRSREHFLFT